MESTNPIHALAIQYFNGTISSKGEKELFHAIENNDEMIETFRAWEKEWIANGMDNSISDASWKKMQLKIETSQALKQSQTESISLVFFKNWFKIASCIILLISINVTAYLLWERNNLSASYPNNNYFVCSAPNGGKSRVELPDGTLVLLNAGSTLRYSQNYGIENRNVALDGEGYFEVTKQKGQNFQVSTNGYNIVVKGTKFNVAAYSSEQFVTTTLVEGLVEITKDKANYILHPGEELTLDKKNGKFSMHHIKAEQALLWSKSQLDFSNITLSELILKLSRLYDVNITMEKTAEKYKDREIRISLKNHETIDDVIVALELIFPLKIVRKGQNINIK